MYPIIRLSYLDGVNLIEICRYSDRENDERQQMIINKRSSVILFKNDGPLKHSKRSCIHVFA